MSPGLVVFLANILALAGSYLLWDLGAWFREKYQGGNFTTIAGALFAHAAIIAVYVALCYAVLRAS